MQKLIIDKPDFKYIEYLNLLLSLDSSDKDITLVYDLKFMTPFIGLLVSSFLNIQKYKVISEIGQIGKKVF